jgi:pimeloyl-ACP methyl ester carboxylesterase
MSKVISKDGTSIAFDKAGSGPAVILVDGAMCYRAFGPMRPLSALLTDHFTVYTYDRRGRGESGDTAPYAVEREIEDIDALIKEAGGSAYVYGISSGAALAVAAAARLPSIKKLALYEPPFMLDEGGRQMAANYTVQLTDVLSKGQRGEAIAAFLTRVGMPADALAGMRQAPVWPMFEAIAPTLAYDNAVMGDSSVPTAQAASVKVPTLVMGGGASPDFMQNAAQALQHAIPGAQYRTLEGQTHEVAAEAIAPVLEKFFAD